MPAPTLIYCADGNRRFRQIAIDAGWRYGARLPETVYGAVYFADQDWRKPDRPAYVAAVRQHRPTLATVLDWEREGQLPEVLAWAEDIAPWVEEVIIVPKVIGGVTRLPRIVGGKPVRLGYSVPTRFAGTNVPAWEFVGWPVHLLGGAPPAQLRLARYLDVRSVDGNAAQRAALHGVYWEVATGRWRTRDPAVPPGPDLPYRAFARSLAEIRRAWDALPGLVAPGGEG